MKSYAKKSIGVLLALLLTFSAFGALAFPAAAAEAGHELIIQCLGYQMIVSCPFSGPPHTYMKYYTLYNISCQ